MRPTQLPVVLEDAVAAPLVEPIEVLLEAPTELVPELPLPEDEVTELPVVDIVPPVETVEVDPPIALVVFDDEVDDLPVDDVGL